MPRNCWQVDEYFNCIEFNFSNTGAYGGLYTRLSQLSWHLQKHPTHSSRRFQHDLTVARPCYVTETEYSPRFHEIPWVSICWIDAFPSSSEHFHEVPTVMLMLSTRTLMIFTFSLFLSLPTAVRYKKDNQHHIFIMSLGSPRNVQFDQDEPPPYSRHGVDRSY